VCLSWGGAGTVHLWEASNPGRLRVIEKAPADGPYVVPVSPVGGDIAAAGVVTNM
jgi:hypothetical protein